MASDPQILTCFHCNCTSPLADHLATIRSSAVLSPTELSIAIAKYQSSPCPNENVPSFKFHAFKRNTLTILIFQKEGRMKNVNEKHVASSYQVSQCIFNTIKLKQLCFSRAGRVYQMKSQHYFYNLLLCSSSWPKALHFF